MIVWLLDLQLPMYAVPITTKVVEEYGNSNEIFHFSLLSRFSLVNLISLISRIIRNKKYENTIQLKIRDTAHVTFV